MWEYILEVMRRRFGSGNSAKGWAFGVMFALVMLLGLTWWSYKKTMRAIEKDTQRVAERVLNKALPTRKNEEVILESKKIDSLKNERKKTHKVIDSYAIDELQGAVDSVFKPPAPQRGN